MEQGGHPFLGGADDEVAVSDSAGVHVSLGGADGGFIDFDADEVVEGVGAFEGEEADAAVGIDEETGAAIGEPGAHGLDQAWEDVEVILEERVVRDLPTFGGEAESDFDTAFGGRLAVDFAQLLVERGFGDGAVVDIDDEPVVVSDEADVKALDGAVPLAADHDTIAVAVRGWAGDDGVDGHIVETAQSPEEVEDLVVFDAELSGVVEVLVLATAAIAVVAAHGGDAIWRGLNDADELGAGEVLFDLDQFDFDGFAWGDEGDEDDEVLVASDAVAAVGEVVDDDLETVSGVMGVGWAWGWGGVRARVHRRGPRS